MPPNGVRNGPCNTSNPSNLTACLEDTAALTLSCVSPGQDAGVAPPGRRLPAPLPPRQDNRPSFYPVLPTPREARIGETQIPFGGSRSHCAAAQPAAGRHQLNTPRAAAAAQRGNKQTHTHKEARGGNPWPQQAALTSGRGERPPAQVRRPLLLPRPASCPVYPSPQSPCGVGVKRSARSHSCNALQ